MDVGNNAEFLVESVTFRNVSKPNPICFTICLFISPDLDGHTAQGTKMKYCPDMFKPRYVSRYVCSLVRT
jgi:hypothetical protein